MLPREITIDVQWGKVAGKWWGPLNVRPVVALHGRGDNAGSFDRLIPLLPQHLSYFAIDLPGHGFSTRNINGQVHSIINFVYFIHMIREKFRWSKISLIGHSMSAAHVFIYAALFPDKCDMVIVLDTLKPYVRGSQATINQMRDMINSTYKVDSRKNESAEPPSYAYEEIIDKLTQKTIYSAITRESAPHLMRGVEMSKEHPGKMYLPFDRRVKLYYPILFNGISLDMAGRIRSPFCHIKASLSSLLEYFDDEAIEILRQKCQHFETHTVDGDHHVHLNHPERVSGIISQFIMKYRPNAADSENSKSKL